MTGIFTNRTPRERVLLMAMAAAALIWLAVTQIWQPMQVLRHDISARIGRIERALVSVQSGPAAVSEPKDDPRTPALILTDTAADFGLTIRQLQPQGIAVRVQLDDGPFDAVLPWIEALQRDHALRPVDVTLTRRTSPGMVGTTLIVER